MLTIGVTPFHPWSSMSKMTQNKDTKINKNKTQTFLPSLTTLYLCSWQLFKLQEKKNSKGEISKASKEDKCSGLRLYFTSSFSSSVKPGETYPHVVRPLSKAASVPSQSRICRPASTRPSRNSIASGFPLTSAKRRVREIGRQEKGGRLRVWVFLQLSNCPNLFSLLGVPGHFFIEVTSGWSSTLLPSSFPELKERSEGLTVSIHEMLSGSFHFSGEWQIIYS